MLWEVSDCCIKSSRLQQNKVTEVRPLKTPRILCVIFHQNQKWFSCFILSFLTMQAVITSVVFFCFYTDLWSVSIIAIGYSCLQFFSCQSELEMFRYSHKPHTVHFGLKVSIILDFQIASCLSSCLWKDNTMETVSMWKQKPYEGDSALWAAKVFGLLCLNTCKECLFCLNMILLRGL